MRYGCQPITDKPDTLLFIIASPDEAMPLAHPVIWDVFFLKKTDIHYTCEGRKHIQWQW